jgi:hypothetical protein
MAYKAGMGAIARSVTGQYAITAADMTYYLKWLSCQQKFAFLDAPDATV